MGKSTQTVKESKEVSPMASPYIGDLTSEAQRLYRSGAGTGVWNGPAQAELRPEMLEGLMGTINMARMMGGGGMGGGPAPRGMGVVGMDQPGLLSGGGMGGLLGGDRFEQLPMSPNLDDRRGRGPIGAMPSSMWNMRRF